MDEKDKQIKALNDKIALLTITLLDACEMAHHISMLEESKTFFNAGSINHEIKSWRVKLLSLLCSTRHWMRYGPGGNNAEVSET